MENTSNSNKINKPLLIIGLLLCLSVIFFAVFSTKAGMLYISLDGDPAQTAICFFDSVVSKNYPEATSTLKDPASINFDAIEGSEVLHSLITDNYSYELIGEPSIFEFTATQQVSFSHLEANLLCDEIEQYIEPILNEKIENMSRHDLYDAEGNYKSSLLDAVYNEAYALGTEDLNKFISSKTFSIKLEYIEGEWKIVTSDEMLEALALSDIPNIKSIVLSDYLSDAEVIKKTYTIAENATYGYEPNPDGYGVIAYENAAEVFSVIDRAREIGLLTEEDEICFSADANFYENGSIEYYLDETILAICWKEWIDGRPVNLSEIKLADASQFRRKLSGDSYGSGVLSYCSTMSKQTNSVVGINADFYAFRNLGITCYNRTVYRFNENGYGAYKSYNAVDTLFIDSKGDFHYFKRGTESTKDEVQKWVDENDILFSVAFGPVIVDNGELISEYAYPIGEYYKQYSRAGLGQLGNLHYLYINVQNITNREDIPRATLADFAKIMSSKGVINGYNLDGGQTGEIYFNNHVFNHVDWGNERTVSDIIYFATALPESER